MNVVAGLRPPDPLVEELGSLRSRLQSTSSARWLDPDGLYVHLLALGDLDDLQLEAARFALDKTAAVTQSFGVTLGGVEFGNVRGRGVAAGLGVGEHAGMLGSVADSVIRWLPADIQARYEDPWKPMLRLGWFEKAPDETTRLQLEGALHGQQWRMTVKEMHLLALDESGRIELLHRGKLPAAA